MSKIKRAVVRNIKKIRYAEIEPGAESIIVLTGKNRQGKTSFADAVFMCFGGKDAIGDMPLNDDVKAENGESLVELDNGLTITRRITKKGTTLTVKDPDGKSIAKPQQFIDERLKVFSFNPMEFAESSPGAQVSYAKKIISMSIGSDTSRFDDILNKYDDDLSVDFTANAIEIIDALINERNGVIYLRRRDHNRTIKTLEPLVSADSKDRTEDIKRLETELTDKRERSETLRQMIERGQDVVTAITNLEGSYHLLADTIPENISDELKEALSQVKNGTQRAGDLVKEAHASRKTQLSDNESIINDWTAMLATRKEEQKLFESQAESKEKLKSERAAASRCDNEITTLKSIRSEILEQAALPVPGMAIQDDAVYINGRPFANLSQSEKIVTSIKFAMALNPELRVMRMMNGNALDQETFEFLREHVAENDFQLWIEWVGDDKSAGYYFVNGEINEAGGQ